MIQNGDFLNMAELFIGPDIILHHTKLFLKPPKIGAAFPLHQDWSYFPTKKNSMIAAIVHLTESSEDMGCLRVVPESHNLGKIKNSHGVSVSTIEHLMAAFYGEGIDNVLVEIDAPETPIMDGSSFDFVEAIKSVGVQEQKYMKKYIKVLKKVDFPVPFFPNNPIRSFLLILRDTFSKTFLLLASYDTETL